MKQATASTAAVILAFGLLGLDLGPRAIEAAGADQHSYFEALVRRADVWKSYSLRDPAQLRSTKQGGYVFGLEPGEPEWATYSPATDTDRNRQDAAKIVIPAFFPTTVLTRAVNASETTLVVADAYKSSMNTGKVFMIDREVVTITSWLSDTSIAVKRGDYGTAAAPHNAGAAVLKSTNSLRTMVRVPLGTEDGHSYFLTWDAYWTDSFVGAGRFNHKAFQLSSGSQDGDAIWLEPGAQYADTTEPCDYSEHIAAYRVRSYNRPGGPANWSLSDGNQLGPSAPAANPLNEAGDFCIKPNTWVRIFLNLRQRANDYDYVDMWVADESREPIQVLFNVPISVRPTGLTPNSIMRFWIEMNSSSDDYFRRDNRDLVMYVRNIVGLRDVSDVRPLLIRPVPGAQAVSGPAAPRNVRIISGS